mgnify:CR=1 FL=1
MKNFIFILSLLSFTLSLQAQTITHEVSELFQSQKEVDCIIVMQDQLDLYGRTKGMTKNEKAQFVFQKLTTHASQSQNELISYLNTEKVDFQSFFIFNGVQAVLKLDQAQYIADHFQVANIVFNAATKMPFDEKLSSPDLSRMTVEWGLEKIKADSVWNLGYLGEGVVIGGQDTGYDFDNSLILDKYRGYSEDTIIHDYNWHDAIFEVNPLHNDSINDPSVNPCGFLSPEPCDDHGHGTHTMGTMVGRDDENFIGVAPQAKWIGCRNMDRGYGKPSTYTECFEWFLAPTDLNGENPDTDLAPHVINNSWGCPEMEGCNPENWMFMETVVNNLNAAGTVVVVSAGNDGGQGCSSIFNPAAIFENSFTVGATDQSDNKAGFSSIGPVAVDSSFRLKPDVVAPGRQVRSIYLNEEFRTWSGTSMAGPHVAGAVALIINANPNLSGEVDIIKNLLKETAVPLTDSTICNGNMALTIPNFYYGYGRIDVLNAVGNAIALADDTESYHPEITLYPNPAHGYFNIIHEASIRNIAVYAMTGEKIAVDVEKISNNHILISNLSKGIFVCKLDLGDGSVVTKKVIMH